MKTLLMKSLTLAFLALTIILSSCSIEKRIHTSGYHIKWNKSNPNSGRQKLASKNNGKPPKENKILTVDIAENNYKKIESDMIASINSNDSDISVLLNQEESLLEKSLLEENCDIILLRNGEEISAKILEIKVSEISYKKCNHLDGPTRSILKTDVFMITYSNGDKELFKEESNYKNTEKENDRTNAKTHAGGIVGFALSVLGIIGGFIWWPICFALGIPAVILGIISTVEKRKSPEKWKNTAWGILSLIFGILLISLGVLSVVVIL